MPVLFAAQFVAFFNWTKFGLIFAIKGGAAGVGTRYHSPDPMLTYFALIIASMQLVVWILADLPVGPGANLYLNQ